MFGETFMLGMLLSSFIMFLTSIVGVYCICSYLFEAIGMYTLAKDYGIKHAWMSFIPVLGLYILGQIADRNIYDYEIITPDTKWFLLIGFFASHIPVIGPVIEILYVCYVLFIVFALTYRMNPSWTSVFLTVIGMHGIVYMNHSKFLKENKAYYEALDVKTVRENNKCNCDCDCTPDCTCGKGCEDVKACDADYEEELEEEFDEDNSDVAD